MLFAWASTASATDAPKEQLTYIVVKGDTLSGIATRFNTTWPVLQKINKIKNPNLIHPNDVLGLRSTELKNKSTVHAYAVPALKKAKVHMVKKATPVRTQHMVAKHSLCDPTSAITQLGFPVMVEQDLLGKVQKGEYEEIVDHENFPSEHARKYVAYDTDHTYAFIYPDSCSWRMKIVDAQPPGKDALLRIPPLPTDRNENEKFLALPLGPTPGNVDTVTEKLPQRKSELIVLVRYLNNCGTGNNCDAREAKGELYMRRE